MPAQTAQGVQLQRSFLRIRRLGRREDVENTRVGFHIRVGLRVLGGGRIDALLPGLELREADLEAVHGRAVGAGCRVQEQAAVGQRGTCPSGLEERDEVPYEHEIKGVDRFEIRAAVVGVFHPVCEAVHGDQDRWPALDRGEFLPQGLENRPGDGRILDAQSGQLLKIHAGLHGQALVLQRNLKVLQHRFVGKSCAQQQCGCGLVLNIQRRVCIRQRRILGVGNDEILGYDKVSEASVAYKSREITLWNSENNPILQKGHCHGLQEVDALPRSPHSSNYLLSRRALLRPFRDPIDQLAQLNRFPSKHRRGPTENRPALCRLERLNRSQVVNQGRRQADHRSRQPCIGHCRLRQLLHARNLERIGIAEHDPFPRRFTLTRGRWLASIDHRLLLHARGLGLAVFRARVHDICLFLRRVRISGC